MKLSALIFCMAVTVAAHAQTASKPAAPAAKPATATKAHTAAAAGTDKLPPGVPPVAGIKKTMFSLRYQDVKMGTGADAEPMKMYKVKYTGWRAADGVKFDSWDEHPAPVMDKDGKPVMGDDGKPKMADPEPASFPVGIGRMIPGFDQGFNGMKIGGKRRLFIPWQLAYGTRAMPDHGPGHPGIPARSDLIFDIELVDIAELPMPTNHPPMSAPQGAPPSPRPGAPSTPPPSAAPSTPPPSGQPSTPPPSGQPGTPPPAPQK
ncbi:MAG TPA: FKBP-type peptidyl-prolyl cis-trans isomerase [Terracidiphilus sp.]